MHAYLKFQKQIYGSALKRICSSALLKICKGSDKPNIEYIGDLLKSLQKRQERNEYYLELIKDAKISVMNNFARNTLISISISSRKC